MDYFSRYATFCSWRCPDKLKAEKFASAGFVFTGYGDAVGCPDCDTELFDWPSYLNPLEEHRRQSPDCCYVRFRRHKYVGKALKKNYSLDTIFKIYKEMYVGGLDKTTFFERLASEKKKEEDKDGECDDVSNPDPVCKICLSFNADVVYLPCKHLVTCRKCEGKCKRCPVCRRIIGCALKTFT